MITVGCSSCGSKLRVKTTAEAFRCPNCQSVVRPSKSAKKDAEEIDGGKTAHFKYAVESRHEMLPDPDEAETVPPTTPRSETPTVPPQLPPAEPPTVPPKVAKDEEPITVAPSGSSGATERETPQIPGYEILGELGRGGMGVVYKARHEKLNRTVALKMILSGGHASDADISRFVSEAEAVAAFQHPNIVQVFEIGHHQGLPFMALEFVGGGSLGGKLKEGALSAKEAARTVEQIARGMNAAHQGGIVHRDLKPDNVLLS